MENTTDCLRIPGYEFWIGSNGQRAKLYETRKTVDAEGRNSISCYIVSKAGEEFCIGVRKRKGGQSSGMKAYLNGAFVFQDTFRTSWAGDAFMASLITGNQSRNFQFSSINYTEDELGESAPVPEELGTIKLEVNRLKNIQVPKDNLRSSPPYNTDIPTDIPTFSEKSKAQNFHTILFKEPEEDDQPHIMCYKADNISNLEKSPWFTLKFLYRPIETLRAQSIVPAIPSISRANRARDREMKKLEQQALIKIEKSVKDESLGIPSSVTKLKTRSHKTNDRKATKSQEPIYNKSSDEEDSKYTMTLIKNEDIEADNPSSSKRLSIKSEIRTRKTNKPQELPIYVKDSDEEDSNYLLGQLTTHVKSEDIIILNSLSSKRSMEPSVPIQAKRVKTLNPTVIVVDSD